jgi:MarR family transcriptional regulator, organic hydroperoxide resistance regulator
MAASTATTVDFEQALVAFLRATRRARGRAAAQPSPTGVSLAQYHLLDPLLDGPRPIGQVAEAAGVAPPTATRVLEGLVRRGFVRRTPAPDDRRTVLVSLTPEGRLATREKHAELRANLDRIGATLDNEEKRQAAALLLNLAEAIEGL